MRKKHKAAALTIACLTAFTCLQGAGLAEAAEAQGDTAADVAQMKEEIAALSARLNELEKQLDAAQAKQDKAEKTEKAKKGADIIWSGSTKSGYMYDENKHGTVKAEVRIKAKTKIDNVYDAAVGLKFKATSAEPTEPEGRYGSSNYSDGHAVEKDRVKLDEASVGRAFGPAYVKLGVQSATIGEGLWLGKSSLNIGSLLYTMAPKDSLFIGYGRDSQDYLAENQKSKTRLLKFIQYEHVFNDAARAGLYFGGQEPERYAGIYGETPLIGKLSFLGEFVHNDNKNKPEYVKNRRTGKYASENNYGYAAVGSHSNTDGYLLSLRYGQDKHAGDFMTSVNYFNVDQNLFMDDGYTAYDDYVTQDGIKGFGLVLDYKTSEHTKLSFERYWAHTKPVAGNIDLNTKSASVESPYYTTYLKFTSKF